MVRFSAYNQAWVHALHCLAATRWCHWQSKEKQGEVCELAEWQARSKPCLSKAKHTSENKHMRRGSSRSLMAACINEQSLTLQHVRREPCSVRTISAAMVNTFGCLPIAWISVRSESISLQQTRKKSQPNVTECRKKDGILHSTRYECAGVRFASDISNQSKQRQMQCVCITSDQIPVVVSA